MFTGKGVLVAQSGSRRAVTYEYVETSHSGRAGHLFSEPTETDPGIFAATFNLECEDGVEMIVVVTQISDRRLGFFGRQCKCIAARPKFDRESF
ncbi:hypothetical protein [Bosea sp. 2RAB26]|uniref:hypothetical protein n=1 Tax=Bosea sp. 2RAB26 TaxID=3237476 RepID=UPI003F8FA02E